MKKHTVKSESKPAPVVKRGTKPAQKKHGENSELTVFEFAPPPSVVSSAKVQPKPNNAFDPEYVISQLNTYYKRFRMTPAHGLVDLAVGVIQELERLADKDPQGVSRAAAKRVTWPVLAGRHTAIKKKNEALFDQIGLGRDPLTPLDFGAVPIDLTPTKKWALQLLQLVEQIRMRTWCSEIMWRGKPSQMTDEQRERLLRDIPSEFTQPLFPTVNVNWVLVFEIGNLPVLASNEKSLKAWQNAVWDLLLLNSNGHPEDLPELCAIGEHRRYHPYPAELEVALKESLVTIEKQRQNIAREVRVNIFEEILRIAQHLQKLKPPTE